MSIETVTFVVNAAKPVALTLASGLARALAERSIRSLFEESVANRLGTAWAPEEHLRSADLCVVLGGDGTLIRSARLLAGRPVPILAINLGALGFMTEVPEPDAFTMLDRVLRGDFEVVPRMKLRVRLLRGSDRAVLLDDEVLNDAVINKGALARIADLEASIGDLLITTYRADGVIVSTPTGSTAYSLAADGPIVYPTMDAVLVTPICPHSLAQRPIVLPNDQPISLTLKSESSEMYLTLDGQSGIPMLPRDQVVIERSVNRVLLIRNPNVDYFSILRAKLKWGAR